MAFSLFSYFFKRVVENMAASFKDRYRRNKETLEWYDALAMAVAVIALVFTFGVASSRWTATQWTRHSPTANASLSTF